MYCLYCFEYCYAWSSLELGKILQHFLVDRVPKFTSFVWNRVGVSLSWTNPDTDKLTFLTTGLG